MSARGAYIAFISRWLGSGLGLTLTLTPALTLALTLALVLALTPALALTLTWVCVRLARTWREMRMSGLPRLGEI